MDYRKSWRLERLCIFIGGILAVTAALFHAALFLCAGSMVTVAGVLQSVAFCRCPACRAFLDPRGGLPNYCPDCGKPLADAKSEK